MKKTKILLTGLLCAVLAVPSVNAAAITINRHSTSKAEDSEMEESSHLDTFIDEKETEIKENLSHIETVDVVEPADIVFVIDSTGSMSPYIQNVADNVKAFSEYLEEKKVDVRMAVVEYRDITCDGDESTIIHTVDGTPWHKTTDELVETLEIIKSGVDGGGDIPETVFDALGYIADEESLKFRSNAHKFAIVLTDANYKEENRFELTKETLLRKLEEQNINTSVITSTRYFSNYSAIIGSDGITTDINSRTFSDDLIKLADVIFKTIEKEVIDETIKSVTEIRVTCKGDNTIKVGNKAVLNAVILPAAADDKKVSWLVEDENIAGIEVSADTMTCTVTGKNAGQTKVIAVSEDGGFTGSYDITVFEGGTSGEDLTEAIEIEKGDFLVTPAKKTISKKKSFSIKVALSKKFMEDKEEEEIDDIWKSNVDSIVYRSSKSSVASVNDNGEVIGKKKGKTIIKTRVALADGTEYTYKSTVYVK